MPKKQYPPDRELAVDPTAGHMVFKPREFVSQAVRVVQLPIHKRRVQPLGAGKPHRGDRLENEILGAMQVTCSTTARYIANFFRGKQYTSAKVRWMPSRQWLLRTHCKTKPL